MQWWAVLVLGSLPYPIADWSFTEAQERYIVESVGLPAAYRSLDDDSRKSLRLLDSKCYRCREIGSRRLIKRKDIRACYIGLRLDSLEVQTRCRSVLRAMTICGFCNGSGWWEGQYISRMCNPCEGVGYYWPMGDY